MTAFAILAVLPGVAAACSGTKVVLDRDLPNADAAVVGTVLMTTNERRLVREDDPEFLQQLAAGPGGDVQLAHTFVRVSRVMAGDINGSLVDVVDVTAGCGITVQPGGRLGVLLTRNGSAWIGTRFSTVRADDLLAAEAQDVTARSFAGDALAGYGDLMRVLASTHDRPVFAD